MSKRLQLSFTDRAKIAWSVMTNSYDGASTSRRATANWIVRGGDADADTTYDIPALRDRSRDMVRNVPLAAGAINTKVTNIVGTGLRLQSQVDAEYLGLSDDQAQAWESAAEREFNFWGSSEECDAERTLTFAEQQELAFRSTLENGDALALMPYIERPGSVFGMKVQLIEADRISNPGWQSDSALLTGGVGKDAAGAPIAYHISDQHPGDMRGGALTWQSYPAFNPQTGQRTALHLYHKLRIGQTRGVPDLAPVMTLLKQLGTYTDAETEAAVNTAFFAILTKTPQRQGLGPAALVQGQTATDTRTDPYKVGPALVLDLAPGEEFETVDPSRPNTAFDPFILAVLRQIGTALELPFEILVKHFTASYSAARAALEDAKRFYKMRRQWLAANFCQPIYEQVIFESIARGRIAAPGFLADPRVRRAYLGDYRNQWVGPSFAQIDPLKENNADVIAEDRAWKTSTEITAEKTGADWSRKVKKRGREQQMRNDAGLTVPSATPTNETEQLEQ